MWQPQPQPPLQLPEEGQPMHAAPFFFSFTIYPMAAPTMATTTAIIKAFVIGFSFYTVSLFALRISTAITIAMATTTARPGRKPAPKLPVVIRVPIWYTRYASV